MSQIDAAANLSDTTNRIEIPLPQTAGSWILAIAVFGTFVGTIKIQSRAGATDTWHDANVVAVASSGATTGNPTAAGNYAAALVSSATDARVILSAYTSGTAVIKAQLIPVGS